MAPTCLIVQRRAHRAGAQVSLLRWLKSGAWQGWRPHVLCARPGWLTDALSVLDVPFTVLPFPSSRALGARLFGNRSFAARVLAEAPAPQLVLGNDHPEGLLSQAVAKAAGCPWVVLFRSSRASEADLRKYACHRASARFVVRGATADAHAPPLAQGAEPFLEGLLAEEWAAVPPRRVGLGAQVLVAGTEDPHKGWSDVCAALDIAARTPGFPEVLWAFTGPRPDAEPPPGQTFLSVGRLPDYAAGVRDYDLVVHASRGETFGLAVLEAWAAGVPVLASNTGVVPSLRLPEALRFEPGDVPGLSQCLTQLARGPGIDRPQVEEVQNQLRNDFSWPGALEPVMASLHRLAAPDPA